MIKAYFIGGSWDGVTKIIENANPYFKVAKGENITQHHSRTWFQGVISDTTIVYKVDIYRIVGKREPTEDNLGFEQVVIYEYAETEGEHD